METPPPPQKKTTITEALVCATGYMQYFVNEVSSFSDRGLKLCPGILHKAV